MNQEHALDTRQSPQPPDGVCDRGAMVLVLDQSALTLPRLVWLVEQRGFRIERLHMAPSRPGFRVSMEVAARAPHYRLDVLRRQVDRLVGVRRLEDAA